jgi:hypothetical protein
VRKGVQVGLDLLLDQVLPLVLVQRGWCVLHGGAVAGTCGAAAFIGPAGHGKSTLTASLASAGLRALTDDTLILSSGSRGHAAVHPAYPSIRVWPETAAAVLGARIASRRVSDLNDKVRVSAGRLEFGREAVRLRVLYLLAPDDTPGPPRAEPIAPRDRVMELVRHAFVLDWDRAERLSALFDTLVRLASDVPVRRLRFSHDYAALPALHRVVLDEVRAA